MKQFTLQDYHTNSIHVYQYEPKEQIKGVVQIIHGASEHFARYGLFSEFLASHGYVVIGCDILGHGLSTDTYDYVHFADKDGDILAYESVLLVKEYIEEKYPGKKHYLLGHSMGSFLARKLIIDFPDFYDKAALSGTAAPNQILMNLGITLTKIIIAFKGPKYVSKLIQDMSIDSNPIKARKDKIIDGINEEWLTRDQIIQQYYHNSRMCGQPFTVSANLAMFSWLKFINISKNIANGNYKLPLFFISGGHDPLSNYGKEVEVLVEKMKKIGYEDINFKIYPEARHEILNEINKDEVYNDLLEFFNR
ncbi:MAG: alpha/beta hydrolase [Candidatus Izemoplasmatales bacterium]|nr:alpha/beta hydrolase [Candidatus Izemoplasmatales bacterium]